jgi:hypothetical protein
MAAYPNGMPIIKFLVRVHRRVPPMNFCRSDERMYAAIDRYPPSQLPDKFIYSVMKIASLRYAFG